MSKQAFLPKRHIPPQINQAFWTFQKKLKPKITQKSSKILKKLKQNPEKNSKTATGIPKNSLFTTKYFQTFENICLK